MIDALIYLVFLFAGAFLGRLSNKGNETNTLEVKKPNLNPLQAYKDHKDKKEAEKEQEKLNVMMENVNNYNGTGLGQRDIPQ